MNIKKIFVSLFLIFLLVPITYARAFTYIDNFKDGDYIFFLIDLEEGSHLELNVTRWGSGNFTIFLFDSRPSDSYINEDNSLKPIIFTQSKTVNYSLDDNPYIFHTANKTNIYYIEIILFTGGPDAFTFTYMRYYANYTENPAELIRYYLPIIPGFQIEYILISLVITVGITYIFFSKKKIRK
ncbi:MAG: hypothetical protein ACFFC3_15030 [Candidatus Odinarchaeota archaeon]